MSKLATVEDVRNRYNLGDVSDINEKVSSALDAATLHLASILRTEFDQKAISDLYWIDPVQEPWTGDFIQLYLSQAFVQDSPALTVKYADTMVGVVGATPISTDYVLAENDKGLVLVTEGQQNNISIPNWGLSDKFFMAVDYTAGFGTTATEFGYVFTGHPAWLKEAAIIAAGKIFRGEADCKDGKTSSGKGCNDDLMNLVSRYIRFFPSARKPVL